MGRGEGPGCYCSVNNMLRRFLGSLAAGYRHVVIDNEAGMEHLSRRTDHKVDLMLVVSDDTPAALKSSRKIADLARGLDVLRGRVGLVVNRVRADRRRRAPAPSRGWRCWACSRRIRAGRRAGRDRPTAGRSCR